MKTLRTTFSEHLDRVSNKGESRGCGAVSTTERKMKKLNMALLLLLLLMLLFLLCSSAASFHLPNLFPLFPLSLTKQNQNKTTESKALIPRHTSHSETGQKLSLLSPQLGCKSVLNCLLAQTNEGLDLVRLAEV